MATYNSLLGCIENFDAALNEKEEESGDDENYRPKWSLEKLEAQYAAQSAAVKKKKKKKKKPPPAPPPAKEQAKGVKGAKPKPKKDTLENLKKYLAREEGKEKVDYDAIIRPSEPIRSFKDIAKKTAELARLEGDLSEEEEEEEEEEKAEGGDGAEAEVGEGADAREAADAADAAVAADAEGEEEAGKRADSAEDRQKIASLTSKSSWGMLAGHFKAKTLFERAQPREEKKAERGVVAEKEDNEVVDLPPGDSAEDLAWLRKWLDKEDERQEHRIKKLGELTEDGDEAALPALTFQMTKQAQAREMQELVNLIRDRQAKVAATKKQPTSKTTQPTQAPLTKQEQKLAALSGKTTSTCQRDKKLMCDKMARTMAIVSAKEAHAKQKKSTKWI